MDEKTKCWIAIGGGGYLIFSGIGVALISFAMLGEEGGVLFLLLGITSGAGLAIGGKFLLKYGRRKLSEYEANEEKAKTKSVKCSNCGASIRIKVGLSSKCEYCGNQVEAK